MFFLKNCGLFPEFEYVDDYSYMFIECIPHCILEFEDFSSGGEWEYFTEDEFKVLQRLYKNSKNNRCNRTSNGLVKRDAQCSFVHSKYPSRTRIIEYYE